MKLVKFRKANRAIAAFLLAIWVVFSLGNLRSEAQTNPIDSERVAEIVSNIERTWEDQYENYFGVDFFHRSLKATQIGEELSAIAKQTGKKPGVIWAIPQPSQLQVLLITPDGQIIGKTIKAANRHSLLRIIKNFNSELFKSLRTNSTSYLSAAQQLYQWIISPIEPNLQAENIDTLLFCVGSNLRSLPLSALHDGENFLVEKYNIALIPAFNLTDTTATDEIPNARVLAMGASEFTDQSPLPGVETELSIITPELWQGVAILNQEFTVENLKSQRQQENFEVIHLATHAQFKPGLPSNSYIQFSDERIGLDRIRELGLNDPQVDLLVLSACKTALGDKDAELGFAGLAIQAGVQSAIGTLWAISDAGTVALMSEFYHQLKQTPIKAEALRQAQIAMINEKVSLEGGELRGSRGTVSVPPELTNINYENLSHPFFWAAFSLIGSPW